MPIYMDLHILPGVKARDVAEAHRRDMLIQDSHTCKCMTYWIDEKRGNVFCLIEAPDEGSVKEMHNNAHGLVPHRIIEVNDTVVESFLGRIRDPEEAVVNDEGLKVFSDPSFRVLLVTSLEDPVLLQHQLGLEKARALMQWHNKLVRQELAAHGGSEIQHDKPGFLASFVSAEKAVGCALAIRQKIASSENAIAGFRAALHAGEPVTGNRKLFGETIQLAERICAVTNHLQVTLSSAVKELVYKDFFTHTDHTAKSLSPQDEDLLSLLFTTLENKWQDAGFTLTGFCQATAMSKSNLYRKTIAVTGSSPNVLLNDFRLEKAKELMKLQRHSITGISFDAGFTSPSYFTKCFKKKYGILPLAYIDLVH